MLYVVWSTNFHGGTLTLHSKEQSQCDALLSPTPSTWYAVVCGSEMEMSSITEGYRIEIVYHIIAKPFGR
jgi:hypothetical protein